jgi:hypothetical protein
LPTGKLHENSTVAIIVPNRFSETPVEEVVRTTERIRKNVLAPPDLGIAATRAAIRGGVVHDTPVSKKSPALATVYLVDTRNPP